MLMAYNYDKLYGTTPNALGEPTAVIVDFFKQQKETNLRVLDIGCGQGRDAMFIARLGHHVVGVDASPNGILSLNEAAAAENLSIKGITANIVSFIPDTHFDILLIDRTLHMLANKDRIDVLTRLLAYVTVDGWVLIADEALNIQSFKKVFETCGSDWEFHLEKRGYLFVKKLNTTQQ